MQFGIFDHLDRSGAGLTEFYEQRLAAVEAYDRGGFACYHLAEHHARPIGMAPSPSVFLSAVAQRTRRLRFAPLVYLLPFYHPLRLLEEICMLDQMSGGRLEIGIGRGILAIESRFYGIDPDESQARYDETLEILRLGMTQPVLTFAGRFYRFEGVPMELGPVQKPMPPFWYGVHGPESAARAARQGFNVVTNEGTAAAREVALAYRAASAGVAANAQPKVGVTRFFVLAESDAEALRIGRRAYARWHASFYELQWRTGTPTLYEKSPDFDVAVADGTAFAGTAETVVRAVRVSLAGVPVNYLLGQFAFGDLSPAETLRSIELFSRHVMPALEKQTSPPT
jgi:alkanesulfonate monooxygenase SsuD/methylene tetrahydromethanopterin reductase-like flavin-dependent oxidoreductase (luciferase family)